jgi:predicted RNA-binding protein with RPS1 domain
MNSDSAANPTPAEPSSDAQDSPIDAATAGQAVSASDGAADTSTLKRDDSPVSETSGAAVAKPARPKIQVGSRRGGTSGNVNSSRPQVARKDAPIADETAQAAAAAADTLAKPIEESLPIEVVAPTRANIPKPSRRDPLTAEMEAELLEAMSSVSLDSVVNEDATEQASKVLELDTRLRAPVLRVEGDNIFFGLTGRNQGFTSVRNFKEPPAIGDQMEIVLKKYNADDGLYEVAVPGASVVVADWSDLEEGTIVEARVSAVNTGGLECMVNNIRGFMPASQVAMFRVEDFSEYLEQKMQCVVMEVNESKRNLVLSHRALLEREREESKRKLLEELAEGDIRDGVVSNIKDFGAFIDLGGVDGLIHISQLSWERVKHPSDVVELGEKVRVKVEKINKETGKIGLSYRDLLDHPWHEIDKKLSVGSTVKGAVTRVAKFGAFVRLSAGVEGLIHISELAHQRIRAVSDAVKEGEEVEVKILSIDEQAQRIALSLKATLPEPQGSKQDESDDEPRELDVAKHDGPLKGGFDRPTGGEGVGLNW